MKNLLIIYNVIFLLAGNVLFSNIHYLNHHSHDHNHEHAHNSINEECLECIIFETNSNCIAEISEVTFSNKNFDQYKIQHFNNPVKFNVEKIYFSRAPPNSK